MLRKRRKKKRGLGWATVIPETPMIQTPTTMFLKGFCIFSKIIVMYTINVNAYVQLYKDVRNKGKLAATSVS